MFVMVRALAAVLGALLVALPADASENITCSTVEIGNTETYWVHLPSVELPPGQSLVTIDVYPGDGCKYGTMHVGTRLSACDTAEPEVDLQSLVRGSVLRTVSPEDSALARVTVYCAPIVQPPDDDMLIQESILRKLTL